MLLHRSLVGCVSAVQTGSNASFGQPRNDHTGSLLIGLDRSAAALALPPSTCWSPETETGALGY